MSNLSDVENALKRAREINAKIKNYNRLTIRSSTIDNSIKEKEEEIDVLNQKIKKLEDDNRDLSAKLDDETRKVSELKTAKTKASNTINEKVKELNDLRDELTKRDSAIADYKRKMKEKDDIIDQDTDAFARLIRDASIVCDWIELMNAQDTSFKTALEVIEFISNTGKTLSETIDEILEELNMNVSDE